jgi:hypothetical protein
MVAALPVLVMVGQPTADGRTGGRALARTGSVRAATTPRSAP